MARHPSLLTQQQPTAIVPTTIHIGHVQLRDLIICPRERGVVNYVQPKAIVEHDLLHPTAPPRTIADLDFTPNCLTSLPVNDGNDTLIAAGGQEAEIHLSCTPPPRPHQAQAHLYGSTTTSSRGASTTPNKQQRLYHKVYDVPMRVTNQRRALREVGCVRLDVPVNHSSISPDGQTLLSVGDSSKLHLHHISGSSSKLTFNHLHSIPLPPPLPPTTANLAASFSTSFSGDGLKFAVGSQEGVVAVYDVRWVKRPVKVVQTDKSRGGGNLYSGGGGMWLNDDPWEWTRGSSKAPGWSARNVKFSKVGDGREVLVFTEHTSYIHILDASTFQTDELIRVPMTSQSPLPTSPLPHVPSPLPSNRHLHLPSPASSRASTSSSPPFVGEYQDAQDNNSKRSRQWETIQSSGEYLRLYMAHPANGHGAWSTARGIRRRREGMVVIPHLGDRALESDVHALLEGHGIVARRASSPSSDEEEDENTGSDRGDYRYAMRGDDMDVDEEGEERECTPSRSTSPTLVQPMQREWGASRARLRVHPLRRGLLRLYLELRGCYLPLNPFRLFLEKERERDREREMQRERERERVKLTYPDDLDIAGCALIRVGGGSMRDYEWCC
ncbi:hypothetical protein BDQ17DRAFT_1426547 [Cyathus striatus]|nr:hypothetical protein BDQ17DRAFT_1426547 [Cyathus striatus]